ncbi:MAG: hypothetical protein ABFD29_02285, partial [Anaerolineaceae bacterium]
PVGGTDKVPTFVAILRSQKGMTTATLIDIQAKDRQLIENLFKKKLLKKQNVNTYADFLSRKEADLEDMFGDEFYLRLVNKEYEDNLQNPIIVDDIKDGHQRLLVRLAEYFNHNPMKGNITFNHYRPARYFVDHIGELEKDIPESAIENFEQVFETLNKLLN